MSSRIRTPAQELLITLRERRAWSQEQLAGRVGVERPTIGRWESTTGPSADFLGRLAKLAGEEGEEELAKGFRRLQLERNRISLHAWQIAMDALIEWNQLLVSRNELTDREWKLMGDWLALLIKSLNEDLEATSEPSPNQLAAARRAVDQMMTLLRREVAPRKRDTGKKRG